MSNALAISNANAIETIFATNAAAIWSIRLDECEPEQRQSLIDHHDLVTRLLRARGRSVRAQILHLDDGEFITLRVVSGPAWKLSV